MSVLLDEFEERVKEIGVYFEFLDDVLGKSAMLKFPRGRKRVTAAVDESLVKILKANAYLLLYNLVESSIRAGLVRIYDAVKADKLDYLTLRNELRDLWIYDEFKPDPTRLPDNNAKRVIEIIARIITSDQITFDSKLMPISGNLNADKVRELSIKFGFSAKTSPTTKGGFHLEKVRTERNNLSHGLKSFSECGRDLTHENLLEIKRQVVPYTRQILRNIQNYIERRQYCAWGKRKV